MAENIHETGESDEEGKDEKKGLLFQLGGSVVDLREETEEEEELTDETRNFSGSPPRTGPEPNYI